jgi:hypothetical protein
MKAIRIHQYGGPEVLAQVEMQRPTPGLNEVLIKIHAASVNPVDWKIRAGYMKDFLPLTLPATLGADVSGTVEEVGPGAARFKRGDEVYPSLGLEGGGYAEYAVAKEEIVAKKPATLNHVQAAAVPVAGLTAWQTLFEVAQLRAGQKVLIHAAAGGVGNFAVQFAKAKGAMSLEPLRPGTRRFWADWGWIKRSIIKRRVLKTWFKMWMWSLIPLAATLRIVRSKRLRKAAYWCRLFSRLRKNWLRNTEFARCSMAGIPVHPTWLKSQS